MINPAPIMKLLALALLVSLVGCTTVNSTERADRRSNPVIVEDARIEVDATLRRKAGIIEIREAVVGNGLLKIQAELYNARSTRQEVNYRFDWIDASGMLIDTPMSRWTRVSLAGKESLLVSGVAPSPRAVDFKLKLIEAN